MGGGVSALDLGFFRGKQLFESLRLRSSISQRDLFIRSVCVGIYG